MTEASTDHTDVGLPDDLLSTRESEDFSAGAPPDLGARGLRVPDLRRRQAREDVERLTRRAAYLPQDQQALIAAIYAHGQSYAQVALLCGQSVRAVRRDVRRILERLADPEFAFVVTHLDDWPANMQRVARACVLAGIPVRRAAVTLRLSLHTVRKYRDSVRLLAAEHAGSLRTVRTGAST